MKNLPKLWGEIHWTYHVAAIVSLSIAGTNAMTGDDPVGWIFAALWAWVAGSWHVNAREGSDALREILRRLEEDVDR